MSGKMNQAEMYMNLKFLCFMLLCFVIETLLRIL